MTRRKRQPHKLAVAHSYWRLAVKAEHAGQWRNAEHYTRLADRAFREYRREQEYQERIKERPLIFKTRI